LADVKYVRQIYNKNAESEAGIDETALVQVLPHLTSSTDICVRPHRRARDARRVLPVLPRPMHLRENAEWNGAAQAITEWELWMENDAPGRADWDGKALGPEVRQDKSSLV
jgi:hypothetical protein